MTSHIAQNFESLCMVGVTTFFPLLAIFLVVVTRFAMGTSLARAVLIVAWVGWGSSGLRGFNPMEITLVAPVPEGGMRYQTGNANNMFGNTSVSKTFWGVEERGLGGGVC